MNERILAAICDPDTHEDLELHAEYLVGTRSGRRYVIRDGIPVFVEAATGQNRKYQELYDRLAASRSSPHRNDA
jgi:uncharacterized protein YbaR (Trm112 family)